jgi:hypothetical protein
MLRTRTMGAALVAVLALSAVMASTAFAALPEFKGPFPKAFTSTSGPVTFNINDATWGCHRGIGQGEITGKEEATLTLRWTECIGAWNCQSADANPGEIVTFPLVMKLGYITKEGKVGGAISPKSGTTIMEYECNGSLHFMVFGGVIGRLIPIDTETNEFTLIFQSNGAEEQEPTKFHGGAKNTLVISINGGKPVPTTIEAYVFILTEALTEIEA